MRLPQDRILHIDTEIANGKMNVVAEWQGEIVRCKDCKHYVDAETIPNKSCCGFCTKLGSVSYYGVDANDYCSFAERKGSDDE